MLVPDDGRLIAFERFARDAYPRLLRIAYLMCGDERSAEDLVQTTLVKAYVAWGRLRDESRRDAYVRKIMVNTLVSDRRRGASGEIPVEIVPDLPGPDSPYEQVDERRRLIASLQRLPPRQRAVVVMRYYEGRSEALTATALDCSAAAVKAMSARALASLRADLEPDRRSPPASPQVAEDTI